MLHQCTGKVVRLNIKFEITVVEFNSTVALVVLVERFNFVSAGTENRFHRSNGTFHFIDNLSRSSALVSKRRGLVVRKLNWQTYDWRFEANRSPL